MSFCRYSKARIDKVALMLKIECTMLQYDSLAIHAKMYLFVQLHPFIKFVPSRRHSRSCKSHSQTLT